MKYQSVSINTTLFKLSGWFFFFRPLFVPYKKLQSEAKKAGFKLKEQKSEPHGIWEKGAALGKGWVAIEVEPQQSNDPRIFTLKGDFQLYKHIGSYKKLGNVFRQLMKENPEAKEFHSIYANDPHDVSQNELITYILFR